MNTQWTEEELDQEVMRRLEEEDANGPQVATPGEDRGFLGALGDAAAAGAESIGRLLRGEADPEFIKAVQGAEESLVNPEVDPSAEPGIHQKSVATLGSIPTGIVKAGIETKDFLVGEPAEADKSQLRKGIEKFDKDTKKAAPIAAGLAGGISQMVTGILGVQKLLAPVQVVQNLKNAGKAGRALYEVGTAALASSAVLDPMEQRLSNFIEEFPEWSNPITRYLEAKPEDSAAEGRFKNALESVGRDFALLGVLKVVKLLRSGDKKSAAREISKLEAGGTAPPKAETTPEVAQEVAPDGVPGEKPRVRVKSGREQRSPQLATEPHTAPSNLSESNALPKGLEAASESPRGAAPQRTDLVDISPEAAARVVFDTGEDLKAIARYGSREAALEAGQIVGRSASRLPWQKLQESPEGLMDFMTNVEKVTRSQLDAIKGGDILTDATVGAKVKEMAEFWGADPAALMGELVEAGEAAAKMTSRMEAAYLVTNRMFQETYDLAFKLRNGMLDEWEGDIARAAAEFRDRLRLSTTLLASAQSMRSNAGRTMRRLRGEFNLKLEDLQALDTMDAARLADVIYSTKGEPKKLAQVVNPAFLRRVMNETTFSLTNSLLWLYPTHVTNIASNLYMLAARPTEKLLGGLAMGPTSGGGILRDRAMREYAATVAALGDAWEAGVDAFLKGDSILNPHNTEFFQGAITQRPIQWKRIDTAGDLAENVIKASNYRNIVGLPTRALGAADEFFKTLRYRAYVQASAATEANAKGLKGEEFKRFVSEEMEKAIDPSTGRALDQKALQEAQVATFQNDLQAGTFGSTLQQARSNHPILTFVLPFIKTPTNVLRYGWKMTPALNLLQTEYRRAVSGKLGGEAQAHAIGQMTLGAAFMGLAAVLTLNGKVTGSGPRDPKRQAELKATGWQPHAFVVEGRGGATQYIPMGRFDPIAMPFTMVADLVDSMRLHPERSSHEGGMAAVLLSIAKSFSDKTFLQNIHQTVTALSDDSGKRGQEWIGSIVGSTIPLSSALKGYANPAPYLRDARGFMDTVKKNLPGFSETLPPTRDVFGETVWRKIGLTSQSDPDEVEAEHNRIMLETGKGLGKPSPEIGGADLRDVTLKSGQNAYDRLQQLSGHIPGRNPLKEHLSQLVGGQLYRDLPDGDGGVVGTRLNALSGAVEEYRKAARTYLMWENPELSPLVDARQRAARGAYLRNSGRLEGGRGRVQELLESLRPR